MEVFDLQLNLLKFCGIFRSPSKRLNIALRIFVTWLCISSFYYMFSAIVYAIMSEDVLNIAESLAPVSSGLYTVVKLVIFFLHKDQFFEVIDEIRELNNKCELLLVLLGVVHF